MDLIVGATGLLGREICHLLGERRRRVRALTRTSSNPITVDRLRAAGAEIVIGDLKERASLDAACRGADVVVTTASSTLSRQPGDSIDSVDHRGQLDLVAAAQGAGVKHFVFVSFAGIDLDFPLQAAKRQVETRLRESGMTYTILQPTCFDEVWLSPALGFDVGKATARIYGNGQNPTSWISLYDVAQFAVRALEIAAAANAVVKIGGPEALSPLEVVALAERAAGRRFEVQYVPEEALRSQYETASDPMQRTFAALMLYYANGDVVDMTGVLRQFAVSPLRTVGDHLGASLLESGQPA